MNSFNVNQRRALSEALNNLAVSIIVVGIITPILSKEYYYAINIYKILLILVVSITLVFVSKILLE